MCITQKHACSTKCNASCGGPCGPWTCGYLAPGQCQGSDPAVTVPNDDINNNNNSNNSGNSDYCSLNSKHTMCKFSGPSDECKSITKFRGLSDAAKQSLLKHHNELRSRAAQGLDQPAAANLKKMSWNSELATIAQRWADQCIYQHDEERGLADGTR